MIGERALVRLAGVFKPNLVICGHLNSRVRPKAGGGKLAFRLNMRRGPA
jgi:hypothetical protein